MQLVTFSIATPLGAMTRVGAQKDGRVVDLAAAYAELLAARGVFAAQELAAATIPESMADFLARWPHSREAAEQALAVDMPATSRFGARTSYGEAEYTLRIPIRPRRLKDYLVYEAHKKKSMQRKGLEMPEL